MLDLDDGIELVVAEGAGVHRGNVFGGAESTSMKIEFAACGGDAGIVCRAGFDHDLAL
ncbi:MULTISPECIES: hypothetical protein [Rhizobium]|uniref:hypothetical protein n=1 Tax=Rhizobium TaxID=379 RepID=UPI0030B881D7